MNNVIGIVGLCVLAGTIAAVLWPRRHTPEARAFAVGALTIAAVIAALKFWRKRA
jgi:hypothetical protein